VQGTCLRDSSQNIKYAAIQSVASNDSRIQVTMCVLFFHRQGKAGKYTDYSQQTGITKTIGQSTLDTSRVDESSSNVPVHWTDSFVTQSIGHIQQLTRQFAVDRDWLQYHTPRNIALALIGEIGELAEIFQFMGDEDADRNNDETARVALSLPQLDKIGQELADVTIYLCRLSDVCQISFQGMNETVF
jgi:dCTP diphosphatase